MKGRYKVMFNELARFFAHLEIEKNEEKYRQDRRLMLNLDKKRNRKNVSQRVYNCGGYALNTFSWYRPADDIDFDYGENEMSKKEMLAQTQKCVDYMLEQFDGLLRVVQGSWELQENEYMIAFKIDAGGENDFHFCKRAKNGHWYHKRGQYPIEKIKKAKVFKDKWVFDDITYYGKTVFLAMKEN